MRPDEITASRPLRREGVLASVTWTRPTLRVGGRTLVEHVITALTPQVGRFVISCGREAAPYEALGHPTVTDPQPGDGPLGGIVSALAVRRRPTGS